MNARPGNPADLPAITHLLAQAGLPTADLDTSHVEFTVLTDAGQLIGAGGVERFAEVALLRSVVVDAARRRAGAGAQLLGHIEQSAREQGVTALFLLTQTAERFFAKNGYVKIARASAADPIQRTTEFRTLCPDSAVCMTKRL